MNKTAASAAQLEMLTSWHNSIFGYKLRTD